MSKKSSLFDDLFAIAGKLPWWVSALLALGAYGFLHSLAIAPIPIYSDVKHLDSMVFSTALRSFATLGQYLLPVIFIGGATASVLGRRKRRNLLTAMTMPGGKTAANITWQQFELLVGEALRHQGFSVEETGGSGPDGGIDLVARKDGEKYLVQCKQWRSLQVGVPVIRELYGAMAAEGATGGLVITSGRFTGPAREFASGRNLKLVDGDLLNHWIAASKRPGPSPMSEVAGAKSKARTEPTIPSPIVNSASTAASQADPLVKAPIKPAPPACPFCKKQMVIRVARSGANAGGDFWGCSVYPKCKGIRPIFKAI